MVTHLGAEKSLFSPPDSRKIVAGAVGDFWTQWHKIKCNQTGHVENEISRSLYQGVTQTLPIGAYLWSKSIPRYDNKWDPSVKGEFSFSFHLQTAQKLQSVGKAKRVHA